MITTFAERDCYENLLTKLQEFQEVLHHSGYDSKLSMELLDEKLPEFEEELYLKIRSFEETMVKQIRKENL